MSLGPIVNQSLLFLLGFHALLSMTLVAKELRVHPLERDIAGLLRLLDAVPVQLVGGVSAGVVLPLGHD